VAFATQPNSDPYAIYFSGSRPEWRKLYMPQCDAKKVELARQAFQGALSKMESLGAIIVDPAEFGIKRHVDVGYDAQMIMCYTEFKEGIAKYLDGLASTDVRNLQDIIE
jgi:hypothetical protein